MKHTPEEWILHDWHTKGCSIEAPDYQVCFIEPIFGKPWKSNAHLIAAAPDLLEACEHALILLQYEEQELFAQGDSVEVQELRAAIKKARGE